MKCCVSIAVLSAVFWSTTGAADWTAARCDIYPRGEDHTEKMIPCVFSQRQGYVTITRDDGIVHDLSPVGDTAGNYKDQDGRAVYRQSGLGDQGQIFRFEDESVYVYWNTDALEPKSDDDNWTAPFTTDDYDATASDLAGTSWQLLKISSMDDSTAVPDDPSRYTLSFGADGSASILADCNRGAGSWSSDGAGQLTFGPLATTRAMCPPGSLFDTYVTQFEYVRSYVLKDGHLFLATMADGSVLEFEPLLLPLAATVLGEEMANSVIRQWKLNRGSLQTGHSIGFRRFSAGGETPA